MSEIITSTDLRHHDLTTRTGRVMWAYARALYAEEIGAYKTPHGSLVCDAALSDLRTEGVFSGDGLLGDLLTDVRRWLRDRVGREVSS